MNFFRMDLDVPHEKIAEEARRLRDHFVDREYGVYSRGWRCLVLHGLGENEFKSPHAYGYKSDDAAPYQWTKYAEESPVTKAFLESLPCRRLYRARFMLLEPWGRIPEHRDGGDGYRISIALTFPEGCSFIVGGEKVPFEPGAAFAFRKSALHSLENWSRKDRFQLVVEGEWNTSALSLPS